VDAVEPPPGISAGSTWLRHRASTVAALAWTAPARAPCPWLAAAHAGGEVDIFMYDMHELLPGATISFRSPSAALALAWNPHRPHVLITGASDQTVRGWNVTLPKYAHPDAQAPLLLAADDGSEGAATSADNDEPAREAAGGQVSDDQESSSARPLAATEDAAAVSSAAAPAHSAMGQSEGGAASGVPTEAAARDGRSAQAALDEQRPAELHHKQSVLRDAAEAPPRELLATDPDARSEGSIAEGSTQQQDSRQVGDTAARSVAIGQLQAEPAADMSPEQQDALEVIVSRPVDLAEVAAIRRGRSAAPPAKSPMRAAASLSVGSLVSRLRGVEATDDTAAATDRLATNSGTVGSEPAGGVAGHTTDSVRKAGCRHGAAGRINESATESAARPGSEGGGENQTESAEVSTSTATDSASGTVPAAEALPREGARPAHGVNLPLHPSCPRHKPSCNVPNNGVL